MNMQVLENPNMEYAQQPINDKAGMQLNNM